MNRIYRTVWNHARQCMVVASETTRGRSKTSGSRKIIVEAVAAAVLALGAGQAMAADVCPAGINTNSIIMTAGNDCILSGGDVLTSSATGSPAVLNPLGLSAGRLNNGGTIVGAGNTFTVGAVEIEKGATLTGGIVNTGLIRSGSGGGVALLIGGATIQNGITNSGTIDGESNAAVVLRYNDIFASGSFSGSQTIVGDFRNLQGGTITGRFGINSNYDNAETPIVLTGRFVNEGLIEGTTNNSIELVNAHWGSITNSVTGTISAGNTALYIHGSPSGVSSITGDVSNYGIITAGNAAISMEDTVIGGRLFNAQGKTITGSTGIVINSGVTINGGIINEGVIHGTDTAGISFLGPATASIINSGTISGGDAGIYFYVYEDTVTGNIVNLRNGLIEGQGSSGGIFLYEATTLDGSIINDGTILGASGPGVVLTSSSTITGGITNTGVIRGDGGAGIFVSDNSSVGGITNSGLIKGLGGPGIFISSSSMVKGAIVNRAGGTITGSDYGIRIYSSSTVDSGITNSGLIQGETDDGINVSRNSLISGGIYNLASGLISGGGGAGNVHGIIVTAGSSVAGIVNAGTITSGIDGDDGVNVTGSTVDFIRNVGATARILGDTGVAITTSNVSSGITNSGLILGTVASWDSGTVGGVGVGIFAGSSVGGGIVNTGTIQGIGGGGVGVSVTSSTVTGGITNAGTISGDNYAILIDSSSDVSHIHLTGTSAKLIGDVSAPNTAVVVKSGAVFGNTNAFDVDSFTVESGGLFNFGNGPTTSGGLSTSGVKVANGFTNDGIVSVAATVAPTITGDYLQNAGGIYRMGLTGTTAGTYGVLNVTGNATVAGGIDVVISGAPTIADGTTVAGVIRSGGMTVTPADIAVTDNNLFLTFTAAEVSNPGSDLDLIIAADPNALPNAVAPNNPGATGVAQALQTIYNGGVPAGFQPVFDALATMTPQELNSALIELTPSLQGAAAQAGINALHSMNKIIQSRIESVQGLNSGDDTADQYAWARVFGNWGDQDNHRGVTGFESQTQGLALGMDKPINDRIRAGGLFTYANTDLQSNLGSSKINVDTYEIAGYGSYNIDPQTDINVQLDVGLNKANSTRRIGFLGTTAKGDFDSFNWHLSGGIGHLFQLSDKTNLTPSFRVDYTHVKTDGYTEKGAGALNLRVDGSNYEELLLTVDTKFSHKLTDDGLKLVANGSVGYDFINEQAQSSSTFTGGGPTFVTNGLDVSPWVYRGGLGLVKETGNGMEFSARYDAEGRTSGYLNQTASVKVRWAF